MGYHHPGIYALLKLQTADVIFLDIDLIEMLDGKPVPPSSLASKWGFTNALNARSPSWLDAGYKVWEVVNRVIEFRRME